MDAVGFGHKDWDGIREELAEVWHVSIADTYQVGDSKNRSPGHEALLALGTTAKIIPLYFEVVSPPQMVRL